jgi:2,3-bisphosphoglycerate-independent phosphoglycerate mutase
MVDLELIKQISVSSQTKIVMLVIDGLGGLPDPETNKTELETAGTPNMDRLATEGICGLSDPVGMGITPGSAPGHLALFGYDPLKYDIGRGALEAVGIDFDLKPGDVAARGNFCTVDDKGLITDRRAGRISTDKCVELCRLLDGIIIDDVEILVRPVREHRLIVVFRGSDELGDELNDSDPQQTGLAPKEIKAKYAIAAKTSGIANKFIEEVKKRLAEHKPANMVLLRGFSKRPDFPLMTEIYKFNPAAIAAYPMYRGLARLVGMEVLETRTSVEEEIDTLKKYYTDYDFFFIHVKGADSAGEDGDFQRKVNVIEQVDNILPELLDMQPDVIVITGDHSTPALLKGHSWHPVPVLLRSRWCRPDSVRQFSESACLSGGLCRFPAKHIMSLAMANALKLTKYGA